MARLYSFKCNMKATEAPAVTNDVDEGYVIGSRWFDVTNDKEYVCLDNSDGAAVWIETTSGDDVTAAANITANTVVVGDDGAKGVKSATAAVTIPTINLTGGQIAFPATAVPSADPNTLDDYEEGTWTATIVPDTSGTITLNSSYNAGAYTKIGREVTVSGRLVVTSVSSPVGYVKISLPFAVGDLDDSAEEFSGVVLTNGVAFAGNFIVAKSLAGLTYFLLGECTTNDSETNVDGADFAATDYVRFGFSYFI